MEEHPNVGSHWNAMSTPEILDGSLLHFLYFCVIIVSHCDVERIWDYTGTRKDMSASNYSDFSERVYFSEATQQNHMFDFVAPHRAAGQYQ